ncbi:APC family permease [Deinococcus sp. MIMF12]|uniref:APC family permease n=1 Tax=Deinococcus rhizophilus TaxID=3049544 RepID=A0ABT7JIS3_9DEIO|nr:APC family permease [Deinococcus rhizophilus]MDL2344955.1 APC family permease [Deinococcus rhizophilus]
MNPLPAPSGAFRRWFLETDTPGPEGFYEGEEEVRQDHRTQPWWKVMCLTGVDYFSTLGYQPGIAALAAGALAPVATLVLVLVTLFGALPMYRRVAGESPHGDGSLSMLERLLAYWPGKLLVLSLLGFVATGFIITITLSAADATAHLLETPLLRDLLEGQRVAVTLGLLALLGAVFLKGFREAVGLAVGIVAVYLGLSLVVVGHGLAEVLARPELLGGWWGTLGGAHLSPLALAGAALLVFPALALGLSGFETGVVVMPLVRGEAGDRPEKPLGRIRNTRKLLTTAALVMSVMLLGSSLVTTLLIPRHEFWAATTVTKTVSTADLRSGRAVANVPLDHPTRPREVHALTLPAGRTGTYTLDVDTVGGRVPFTVTVTPQGGAASVTVQTPPGKANGRALAYLAHERLGDGFGSVYDLATILILWFAGASAMAGLLNIVPRYLPRYGMAPDWTRATRPLVVLFTGVSAVVTALFRADVDAQAGAYATGVLALMTSAAIAVFLTERRRGHRGAAVVFALISVLFIYTSAVTVRDRPEGLWIALLFVLAIVLVSAASRVQRSTELRVQSVVLDGEAQRMVRDVVARGLPLRLIANRLNAGDAEEYRLKALEVRLEHHLAPGDAALFLEVAVTDASEFSAAVPVCGVRVGPHAVLRARGSSVPNTLAAVLLWMRDHTGAPPHVYFEWSEKGPAQNALRFLLAGEGDIPPLTHEVLRVAEPDVTRRPRVHVGG